MPCYELIRGSLNASTIDLCLGMFPWADFRKKKGAVKLHAGLNSTGYLPELVTITDGKVHDVIVGRTLKFPPGSIVAIDKGYNDYAWYNQVTDKGISFVTRLKTNARYRTVKRRTALKDKGLSSDQTIEFSGVQTARKCPIQLRRIGYTDPEKWPPKIGQRDKCLLGSSRHLGSRFVVDAVRRAPVKRLVPSLGIVEGEIPAQ